MNKLALIPTILILLLLAACSDDTSTALNPIPTSTTLAATEEAPDDVIFTPGGLCYRANSSTGESADTFVIESTKVVLDDNDPESYLYYRSYIETRAGENRNNIFRVTTPVWDIQNLELCTGDMPLGIEVAESEQWHGPRTIASILTIMIAEDNEPGEYTFEIYMEIDGESYGSAPCTIKVID
jgi:hypothetical protein